MRISRLELYAFGPFTDRTLDLAAGAPGGLHVLYGPNEAGKSSALRAVLSLLYGFEERTTDAHLHPYERLRVGGVLEANGTRLTVERKKKRKGSLTDPSGEPIDEALLRKLLGGIDREGFVRSFGLGHAVLAEGGEQMLRGEASVGETLFDAGTGGLGVRRVLSALETEQERLFRPRGKQEINLLLDRQSEARKRAQDAWLLPESFAEQVKRVENTRAELAELAVRIESMRAEQHRLRDLKNALPTLQRRAECLRELEALGDVPDISETASERREAAQARAAGARAAVERLETDLEDARRRLGDLEVPETLLALGAARIKLLSDGVGRTRKAREDRPRLESRVAAEEADARAALRRLGRDGPRALAEQVRVSSSERLRIVKLAAERDRLEEQLSNRGARRAELERELDERKRRLARLPEAQGVDALERVATLARSFGDLDTPLLEHEDERAELERTLAKKLRELTPFFHGDALALAQAAVPSTETIERFAAEAAGLDARERALSDELGALSRRLLELDARILRIQAGGEVPSELELERMRGERDAAQARLIESARSRALDEVSVQTQRQLSERADGLADRLRRDADRVAELGSARADRDLIENARAAALTEQSALGDAREKHAQDFAALFRPAGITPLSPGEMRGFLARREQTLELVERASGIDRRLERLRADRLRLERAVAAALGADDDESDTLLVRVERCATRASERARLVSERSELERAIDAAGARFSEESRGLEATERALAEWRLAWAEAVRPLGAGTELTPEAAHNLLEEVAQLAARLQNLEGLEQRVAGILRDEAALAGEVRDIARAHAIPFDERVPDAAAQEIVERFRRGENAREERSRLGALVAEREAELADERAVLAEASRELAELSALAGARDPEELQWIEGRSRKARELRARLAAIEATLVDSSGGRPIATLVAELAGEDAPRLAARLDELELELADLDERRESTRSTLAGLLAGQKQQSAGSGAEAAQDEQAISAALRERVGRYARLRVASALLDRAIERYRRENQAPILKRASELFPRLTEERYRGLRVGREESAIVALRADGRECAPGDLSEGTRYQLYLALRLASIERFVESAEPLPLVLDDALIHFDDNRKRAAFAVLGELSERLQILFFTHHERDVELALEAAGGRAFRHELVREP
jgi:uncharacterized protein YhaN